MFRFIFSDFFFFQFFFCRRPTFPFPRNSISLIPFARSVVLFPIIIERQHILARTHTHFCFVWFTKKNSSFIGTWIGGQRIKGLESKAYHSTSFTTCHPRRRRIGQSHQSYNCRWWCHSAYSQIAHWQKRRSGITGTHLKMVWTKV